MTTDLELIRLANETNPEEWESISELLQQTDDADIADSLREIQREKYSLLEKEPQRRGKRIPNHYKIREKSNLKKFKGWKQ